MQNYYAPLTSRVEKLEKLYSIHVKPTPQQHQSIIRTGTPKSKKVQNRVKFTLLGNHLNKDSSGWRKKKASKPATSTPALAEIVAQMKKDASKQSTSLRNGLLDGSVPSAISDTGALASAFKPSNPTITTGIRSNTSFGGAFGNLAVATTINKLRHKLREPAKSVHIVPQVKDSLLNTSKCVDANYIAI